MRIEERWFGGMVDTLIHRHSHVSIKMAKGGSRSTLLSVLI